MERISRNERSPIFVNSNFIKRSQPFPSKKIQFKKDRPKKFDIKTKTYTKEELIFFQIV